MSDAVGFRTTIRYTKPWCIIRTSIKTSMNAFLSNPLVFNRYITQYQFCKVFRLHISSYALTWNRRLYSVSIYYVNEMPFSGHAFGPDLIVTSNPNGNEECDREMFLPKLNFYLSLSEYISPCCRALHCDCYISTPSHESLKNSCRQNRDRLMPSIVVYQVPYLFSKPDVEQNNFQDWPTAQT